MEIPSEYLAIAYAVIEVFRWLSKKAATQSEIHKIWAQIAHDQRRTAIILNRMLRKLENDGSEDDGVSKPSGGKEKGSKQGTQ